MRNPHIIHVHLDPAFQAHITDADGTHLGYAHVQAPTDGTGIRDAVIAALTQAGWTVIWAKSRGTLTRGGHVDAGVR